MEHDYIIQWWLSEKSYFSRNWVHSSIQRHVEESCITIMPSCSHHNYKKTRLIEIALLASASCGKKLWMRWAYWMLKSNRRSGSRCFLYQYTSYERRISSFELRGWIQYGDWLSNLDPKKMLRAQCSGKKTNVTKLWYECIQVSTLNEAHFINVCII